MPKKKKQNWSVRLKPAECRFLKRFDRQPADQLHRDLEQLAKILGLVIDKPKLQLGDLAPILDDNILI